jgi:predicted  nucleic acid-binding Zn-ribbon protein
MHQLTKIEAEAAAYMDEESKYELREQKIRLDKEFGDMLLKIGNRKDILNSLESRLTTIDKARQSKEEELRTLERKLVVLLEEQQNELNAIKKKQGNFIYIIEYAMHRICLMYLDSKHFCDVTT